MNKVGRNDPCPCGSGKKYKKCHGASNVIEINPKRYNDQLAELHAGLMDFASINYENELADILRENIQPEVPDDDDLFNLYTSAIVSWSIFHQPLDNGKTIFDIYYQRQQKKIKNERVRKVFYSWSEAPLTFYEIVSVDKESLFIEDIRTNKTYQVNINESDDFEAGNLLVGVIIPYIQEYRILLSIFELYDEDGKLFDKTLSLTDSELRIYYPHILADAIIDEASTFDLEYGHFQYYQVATLLEQKLKSKEASGDLIKIGKIIWKLFTDREFPIIRKPEAYVAALEYVIQTRILNDRMQTQKDLADEYQVAVTTISKNARQITETVNEELDDLAFELEDLDDNETIEFAPPPMEQSMRDIQRLIDQQEFESEEEMHDFLNQVLNNEEFTPPASTEPRDLAQDKLFEAKQTDGAKRQKLIKEALEIYPNNPEAYLLIAEDEHNPSKQFELIQQAVNLGRQDLGEDFFKENTGHFWLMIETRPFMRAKAKLASFYLNHDDIDNGIAEFEDLIILNPNDNQGVRYILLTLYLEQERYEDAQKLIDQYKDDKAAVALFSRALIAYFTKGMVPKTIKLLKEADQRNPHVKKYLTGKEPLPRKQFDYIGRGDESEAITYVQENFHLWNNAAPLLNKLAEI
ncbi:SEC-C metal-binding domain-containing protein [Amphibacillus indicireducens]|uniref:Tetratricopeptide repeat protein n=1 Tax=Amphibacillus indicireducens TaxID=1076330 RepID=A0ABP7VPX6_9BACI